MGIAGTCGDSGNSWEQRELVGIVGGGSEICGRLFAHQKGLWTVVAASGYDPPNET